MLPPAEGGAEEAVAVTSANVNASFTLPGFVGDLSLPPSAVITAILLELSFAASVVACLPIGDEGWAVRDRFLCCEVGTGIDSTIALALPFPLLFFGVSGGGSPVETVLVIVVIAIDNGTAFLCVCNVDPLDNRRACSWEVLGEG